MKEQSVRGKPDREFCGGTAIDRWRHRRVQDTRPVKIGNILAAVRTRLRATPASGQPANIADLLTADERIKLVQAGQWPLSKRAINFLYGVEQRRTGRRQIRLVQDLVKLKKSGALEAIFTTER